MTRIAVTGLGLVTPLGLDATTTWQALLGGATAGCWINPASAYRTASGNDFGAPVALDHSNRIPEVDQTLAKSTCFALLATQEALRQAGLSHADLKESACVIGTSKPDFQTVDKTLHECSSGVPLSSGLSALYPSMPAVEVAHHYHIHGPVLCPVAACATGLVSLIRAAELIRHGTVSQVICGSTDASLHPGLLASYKRLGVLAKPGDDPATACRPFDRTRTGFIVGEGAAVFVLEDWQTALSRGAKPIAEWIDGQIASDPTGITQINESGAGLTEIFRRVLNRNSLQPEEIDAICYHGTATRMNDFAEANAMLSLYGAANRVPDGFGIKGAIGHLMGAAGAVEAAISILALQDRVLPPTANFKQADPDCPIPLSHRPTELSNANYLLKTSLGFGGHLAVGLLKRV